MSSLKCRIIYKNGVATVVNLDGTPSDLYQEALALTGSQDQALKIWSTAYSEVFATEYGVNYKDQYKLDDVLTFLDTHDSLGKRLDAQQRSQVVSLMQTSGIESLSDLSNTLNKIFKKNGILELDPKAALKSKLYTEEDLKDFDIESVRDILEAIDGELVTNDIETTPQDKTSLYNSSRKTVLGTSEKVTVQEIESSLLDAIDDFSSEKEVDAAINASPYSEAVTKELRDKLLSYTRVPVVSILDGELTTDNLDTYTTISNTLTTEYSPRAINKLEANVRYFSSLSEEVLTEKRDVVVKVLKEVEQEHAEIGIDLVGLSRFPNKVKDMLPLLESAVTMLEFPTEANVRAFAALKDNLITPRKNSVATIVKPAYKGLTVVRLDTNIPLETLYREHQLIKIGENLFHKVSSENTADDLSEALYNKVLDGGLKISTIKDYKLPENKVQVLKDIRKHVLKQQVPGYTNSKEMVVLHQLVFEHLPIKADPRAIDRIGEVTSDINYLKDDFVADFYKMILVEKAKDSTLYRTKLSAFTITDNDISLHRQIDNLDGILMQKELEDYIRIKKDSEMNYLLPASKRFRNGILDALNNPDQVKEYSKPTRNIEDFIVTEPNDKDFIKVNGELYRQLVKDSNASVFAKVEIEPGSYYQTDANKYFNLEDARKALDDSTGMFTPQETTKEDHEQYKKEVGVELKEAPKKATDKQTTQLVAEYLKGKLGMGISILSNSDMRTELAKRGYDSSNNTSTEGTLLTANDKVYGFYDGTTGGIYLTEDFLNSGTLVHEHWHAFKPALKAKANKGDKTAQMLLDKMASIVDESGVFNEAEFSARYDAANNKFTEWSENRKGKGDKKILERNQAVQQSAIDLKAGRITNEQHRQNVKDNSPIEPITTFYKAASEKEIREALSSEKLPKVNLPVQEGKMVALRLDIPAYKDNNTWVVTVHEAKTNKDRKGTPISLTNVARITNAVFNSSAAGALKIATKEDTKQSIIRINGNWKNFEGSTLEERGLEAEALVNEIKDNPEWVQVGTNPFRQSFFYDRANGIPVKTAEEVVQIGGLIYAKNAEYGNLNDPEYTVKGLKDAAGNPVQFSAENVAYHGGDLSMGIDGPLFVSEDRNQAEAYVEGNNGSIQKFNLNDLNIANEEDLIKILKDNEFTPAEGWTFDELNIHEILDPNFSDTSLSKPELDRLYEILSLKGIDAVRFTDSNLQTLKQDINNIVVFNTDKLSNVKMSTTLSSEAYNPRPGESKEDYIDRMREEIEANLLGSQGEEYFKRIAEENNLTEEQAKTFLGKIKDFIKQFSEWLSNQLGFNNLTPEQVANLTTKDAMDRIITTMLRNDTGAKKAVLDEKLKGFIALESIGFKFVKPFEQKDIDNISCS